MGKVEMLFKNNYASLYTLKLQTNSSDISSKINKINADYNKIARLYLGFESGKSQSVRSISKELNLDELYVMGITRIIRKKIENFFGEEAADRFFMSRKIPNNNIGKENPNNLDIKNKIGWFISNLGGDITTLASLVLGINHTPLSVIEASQELGFNSNYAYALMNYVETLFNECFNTYDLKEYHDYKKKIMNSKEEIVENKKY